MKISIFGLGYVGAVSAGCLAKEGHQVVGVDPNLDKVNLINDGHSPIIEEGIGEIIRDAVECGRLRATTNVEDAVNDSDISLICVGTPSRQNGSLDLTYVERVCTEIGAVLKHKSDYHVVVARSTMLPGSVMGTVIPALEQASGKQEQTGFGVCINPEFLREGTAVHDYFHPPKTVIGESCSRAGDLLVELYGKLEAPLIRTDLKTAEMVKYTDNVWHALKVSFANEIGVISKELGIDAHKVMDIFCQDKKLNISPYYMKPGFAFGGSCLPKDVRALTYKARTLDLSVPVLDAINPSNAAQVKRGLNMILAANKKKIGILGFSFKAGTDDLRESPIVEVIELLIGKGYDLRLYDQNVNLAKITGANKSYILERIPHISNLMTDSMDAVLAHSDVVVVGNNAPEFKTVLNQVESEQLVIDWVRIGDQQSEPGRYEGICW